MNVSIVVKFDGSQTKKICPHRNYAYRELGDYAVEFAMSLKNYTEEELEGWSEEQWEKWSQAYEEWFADQPPVLCEPACPNCGNNDMWYRNTYHSFDEGGWMHHCENCEHRWKSEIQ